MPAAFLSLMLAGCLGNGACTDGPALEPLAADICIPAILGPLFDDEADPSPAEAIAEDDREETQTDQGETVGGPIHGAARSSADDHFAADYRQLNVAPPSLIQYTFCVLLI
jgi:hypothetical protein